jgi:hypothetical protein
MRLGLGLGLSQSGGAGVDPGIAVQTRLSGTAGFAFDPIAANLFQDTAGATPVVNAADPVGRMNYQWGIAPPNWQQATGGSRPAWDGTGMAYDGVASWMATFSNLGLLNNVSAFFACERVQVSSLAVANTFVGFSANTAAARFQMRVNADGSVSLIAMPIDGGSTTTITTAAGLISAGTPYVITAEADFAGTAIGRIWINGVLRASTAITGGAANTSATNSSRARKGGDLSGAAPTVFFAGWMRRSVYAPYVMNDTDRANIEAWVGAI